jgi:hypothetical protein
MPWPGMACLTTPMLFPKGFGGHPLYYPLFMVATLLFSFGSRPTTSARNAFIPQGYKFRLSRQAAQLSFIPQGYKFRLSRQAAQLSFIPLGFHNDL